MIFALLRQKDIKPDDIIIEFSIGSRTVICDYKDDYIEIVKNEGEVSIIDEFSDKEAMIILFIQKKKKEEMKGPPKQLYSENRNAGLHKENDNYLHLKEYIIAVNLNKKQEEDGPKNDSPVNNPKEDEITWDIELLQNRMKDSKKVDLIFLSSDPLVYKKKVGGNICEYENPLNTENEFKQICQQIKNTKKQFTIMRDIATRAKLLEAFNEEPLMLHISCHGDVEKKQGEPPQHYLLFEKSEEYCILENLYEVNFKDALVKCIQQSLAIVFVSACYSEGIAKLFKRCGVPIVIAINSLAQVHDKAAIKFAEEFYKHLVLGKTPLKSFEEARAMVLADNHIPFYSCCCCHKHESWCKWNEDFPQTDSNSRNLGHQKHCHQYSICKCEKKESNMHKKDCKFYMQFQRDCCPQGEGFPNFNITDKDGNIQLCCCQTGIEAQRAHREYQKFKIIQSDGEVSPRRKLYEEQVLNTPLFKRDNGQLKVQWDHEQKDQLIKHKPELIIGRHSQIHKIFEFIHNKEGKQLLHIYGESGLCKTYIANYAAKYALYGRSDLDGALNILAEQATNSKELFKLIYKKLCEKKKLMNRQKDQSIESFVLNYVATRKLVIIFDRMQNVAKYEKNNKKQPWVPFKQLITSCKRSKIIVISNNKDDFNVIDLAFKEQLQIVPLIEAKAARLLIYTTKDSEYLDRRVNEKQLEQHDFFRLKICPLKPIILLNLIKNNKIQDLVRLSKERKKEELEKKLQEASLNHEPTEIFEKQLKRLENSKQEEEEKGDSLQKVESGSSDQCTRQDLIEINMGAAISTYHYFTDQNFFQLVSILDPTKHKEEYQLFIMACITPEGFLESDIDEICTVNNLPVKWRDFFEKVSSQQAQEVQFLEINFQGFNEEDGKTGQSPIDKKIPIFFDLQKKDDIQKKNNHYLPTKIVCDHFSQNYVDIIMYNNIQDFFPIMIKYMAVLARDVLGIVVSEQQQQNNTPIDCICATTNQGIWKQDFEIIEDEKQKKKKRRLQKNRVISYYMHEKIVLNRMLQLDNIKKHFALQNQSQSQISTDSKSINNQDVEVSKYICDFCISTISIKMLNGKYYDAWEDIIQICEPIAAYFNFDLFKAKLLLLKASLGILIDDSIECMKLVNELKDIEETFQDSYYNDPKGYADYYYLQAKLKMKLITNLVENSDNSSQQLVQNDSDLQKTPKQMMEQRTPQIEEENKQFDSLSPIKTPNHKEQMSQMLLDKSSSFERSASQASGKKEFNIGDLEKEIYLNLREAKQYYTYEDIANCLLSEAEFKMSKIGQRLYFRELDDTKSGVNSKDKSLLQGGDSGQDDLKKFERYFNEITEILINAKASYAKMRRHDLEARAFTLIGSLWSKRFDLYINEKDQKKDDPSNTFLHESVKQNNQQLRSYISKAVFQFEKASSLYQQQEDQIEQMNVTDLIQKVTEKTSYLQDNLIIFANSFPLFDNAKKLQEEEQFEIASLTSYKQDFVEVFKNLASNSKIPIIIKQEILNKASIEQIVKNKVKILHLHSQLSLPTHLCIEGENARAKYINDILTEFSIQDVKNNCDRTFLITDLVVLAMPTGNKIAEKFIQLNVKNALAFRFESLLQGSAAINIMSMINEYIMMFCQSFYTFILSRKLTVEEAFNKAVAENEEGLSNIITQFLKSEEVSAKFNKSYIDFQQSSAELKAKIRPFLNTAIQQEGYIFGKLPCNPNKSTMNTLVDSSRPLSKSNIDNYLQQEKHANSFTVRKLLLQEVYDKINNPSAKIVEINGEKGIGKTRLILETADYLRRRNKFQRGIFYLDMKDVKTRDQFEQITFQYDYLQFNDRKDKKDDKESKQFCLIFDNIDDINPRDGGYLRNFIYNIGEIYTLAKLIVISKVKLFSERIQSVVVLPMNENEVIEFVSTNCKLNLVDNVMQIIDKQNVFGDASPDLSSLKNYLLQHEAIQACYGNPEILLQLCRIFENKGTTEYTKIQEVFQDLLINFKLKARQNEQNPQQQQFMSSKTIQNQNPQKTATSQEKQQSDYKAAPNWFREGETFNIVPHNPEFPPLEEEKISKEPHLYLTHDNEDKSQPMGYAGVFGHLNQPRNTMRARQSDLNPEPMNQEEIDLQLAIEKSKLEQ